MCRTVHSILGTIICGLQMLVRVMMTIILMLENLIRMFLQTFYNFISFMLQMISLVPICLVFLITSRLKCFMCGGGGPCPVNRGGTCDCLMSAVAIIILFFIFRATGLLDKIFYKIGYAKATPEPFTRFVPTPGDITECSRETNETEEDYDTTTTVKITTVEITTVILREETDSDSEYDDSDEDEKSTVNDTTTETATPTNRRYILRIQTKNKNQRIQQETKATESTIEPTTAELSAIALPAAPTTESTRVNLTAYKMFDDMLTTLIYYIE